MIRIGHSKDIHRLKAGNVLRLGGIDVPSSLESVAHSDGDCLLHSIAEAFLGALALGDIGTHYPDTKEETKGMDSGLILKEIYQMVLKRGYTLVNLDSMILLERPKLRDYIDIMRERVAALLDVSVDCISIKATTGEGLDSVGKQEAVMCETVLLVQKTGAHAL